MEQEKKTPETPHTEKKPVLVYILALFIAAFLLMALSFFMHQRTTSQGLGELQHSFAALQDSQQTQEKLIALQEELVELQESQVKAGAQLDALQTQLENQQKAAAEKQTALENALLAMEELYALHLLWDAGERDRCLMSLQSFEDRGLPRHLPTEGSGNLPAPSQQYETLKLAVLGTI